MLSSYKSHLTSNGIVSANELQIGITESLLRIGTQNEEEDTHYTLHDHLLKYHQAIAKQHKEFRRFLQQMAQVDYTWRF